MGCFDGKWQAEEKNGHFWRLREGANGDLTLPVTAFVPLVVYFNPSFSLLASLLVLPTFFWLVLLICPLPFATAVAATVQYSIINMQVAADRQACKEGALALAGATAATVAASHRCSCDNVPLSSNFISLQIRCPVSQQA